MSVRPLLLSGPEAPLKGSIDEQKRWDTARKLQLQEKRSGDNLKKNNTDTNFNRSGSRSNEIDLERKSSALFYDPFEAKRVRNTDTRTEVLWSVGATCSAVVVFRNPLSCPLYLTAVTLLGQGKSSQVKTNIMNFTDCLETSIK